MKAVKKAEKAQIRADRDAARAAVRAANAAARPRTKTGRAAAQSAPPSETFAPPEHLYDRTRPAFLSVLDHYRQFESDDGLDISDDEGDDGSRNC